MTYKIMLQLRVYKHPMIFTKIVHGLKIENKHVQVNKKSKKKKRIYVGT